MAYGGEMQFRTENGSVYILDHGTMGWMRKSCDKSGRIRQEFGTLVTWPTIEVGYPAMLHDNKVLLGHVAHFVYTSNVTEVIEDARP
jgi:hypothetical protein